MKIAVGTTRPDHSWFQVTVVWTADDGTEHRAILAERDDREKGKA